MKKSGFPFGTAASLAIILAISLLVTGRGLVPGKVMSSASLLLDSPPWSILRSQAVPVEPGLSDIYLQMHPWLIYASREIRNGSFPLWNPHSYAGAPFFANMQCALLSPFSALAYFLDLSKAIGLSSLLKLVIAGTSMFWYLRIIGLGTISALTGGVTYMLSGFIIAWLGWPLTSAGVWVPLLLALMENILRSNRAYWTVLFAAVIAVDIFSGHPETSFFGIMTAFIYAMAMHRRANPPLDIRSVIFPFALGFLLASVQTIPFLEYLQNGSSLSSRASVSGFIALPLGNLMLFFSPAYWGWTRDATIWNEGNLVESTCSVGMAPWLLLPCAAIVFRNNTRWKFAILTSLISLLIGFDFPVIPWAFSRLPVFHLVATTRIIMVAGLGLAISAGFGVEGAIHCPPEKRRQMQKWVVALGLLILLLAWAKFLGDRESMGNGKALHQAFSGMAYSTLLVVGMTLAIMAVLSGMKHRAHWALIIVVVQAAGMIPFAWRYWPAIPECDFYPTTPAIEMLKNNTRYRNSFSRTLLSLPNISAVYGLYDVSGYDCINPRNSEFLMGSAQARGGYGNGVDYFARGFNSPVLDIFGVEYVLSPPGAGTPSGKFIRAYDGRDGRVFRNMNVLPRAFLAEKALYLPSQEGVLLKICSGYDLRNTVLLTGIPPANSVDAGQSGSLGQQTAEIIEYRPNRVVINTQSLSSAWLVLTDTWYPGWRARIDGRNAPIHRADYAFRAVRVPPGAHTVDFSYLPGSFLFGLGLTILGLLICVILLLKKATVFPGKPGLRWDSDGK